MRSPTLPFHCALATIAALISIVPTRAVDSVTFTDVTKQSHITFSHVWSADKKYILESMSGGVAVFDFDNDGLLDIYLVNSPTVATAGDPRTARSELWRNQGDGTFVDVTDKAGVGYPGWGMGAVAADFDNDGWDDLYVTCYGPNKLYHNNGNGTFSDVTEKAGVGDPRWSTGAAFADYDGDGWLDLFVANYVDVRLDALPEFGKGKSCEFHGIPVQCGPRGLRGSGDSLYHNRRDGTFEDVSVKAGVSDPDQRFGMGAVWTDVDGDGRPDLYVANDAGPNYLYKNNGDGTFTDVALQSGTALSEDGKEQGSMGIAIGDYDHSGGWSIFVTNFSDEYNALYRHDKGFQFTDVSFASRTARRSNPLVGWGTHFIDYDNDGWVDVFVANGHDAVGADVAVVVRLFDEIAAGIEQRVVAAPRVDGDAVGTTIGAPIESLLNLTPQPADIPVQGAIVANGRVRKPAQLVERQDAGAQPAAHHAPALRSKIDGQEISTHTVRDPSSARHRPCGRDSIRPTSSPGKKFRCSRLFDNSQRQRNA